jgi:hypothetical protein
MDSIPQASATELAYIAGYIDGEGCIRWEQHSPCISVETCSPHALKLIKRIFGGTIFSRKREGKNQTRRTTHRVRYYGDNCILVIKMIYPYLLEKKDQAEHLMDIYKLREKLKQAKRKNHEK